MTQFAQRWRCTAPAICASRSLPVAVDECTPLRASRRDVVDFSPHLRPV